MVDHYELTKKGIKECEDYIAELNAKRKEILDARKDTADNTELPTIQDIFDDALSFGIDDDGEIYNSWGVTDNYNADNPICLKLGVDFVSR